VLAIAGDLSLAEARKIVEPKLSEWKKAGVPRPAVVDPPALGPATANVIARPNSVQTTLWVGTQGISRTSPDYDALTVLNTILGGGATGRLFTRLREEKGYTYGASSGLSATLFRGWWIATTDVRSEVTGPALDDLMAEIARIRNEAVPAKEFDDRRRGIIASFALSLEQPAAVLNNHVNRYLYRLPLDYWDTLPARTMAVTQADVQAAARKYLDPARLQIVAVGDPAKIRDVLKKYGSVDVWDANGNRVAP
jgi:zinc protease